ncbi:hypothetical protein LWC33_12345 [Pseudonocardia sp. RS11V-5]|uniref:hypothetical protein n=1 Tax=Pseudonocardia terrae TaxID=2905831 RepID=UPI001E60461A|nr:hypothetical protein [Pseudonocardia terrae]MCE3552245.1 hypothetical protein [Pseudonocardia terrae]
MRIHAVTPIHVGEAEVARRQARYDALAPRGVRVELHDIGPEWSGAFLGVTVLDLAVEDIEDADRWARAVRPALEQAGAAGADVVLNGCSAVDVEEGLDPALPRLLDPISTALRLLA